jgi:hypothetical protein
MAVLFILGIPAYGYWTNFVAPPKSVILQIDDTKYTLGFVTDYMKGLKALYGQVDLNVEPFILMQQLQQDEFIKSGAVAEGITLEPGELEEVIRERIIGSSPELTDVPQDQVDREFNEAYIQFLDTSNLSEHQHRSSTEAFLLKEKLKDLLGKDIPTIAKQANLSWIVVDSKQSEGQEAAFAAQNTVLEISERLSQGENFATLAEAFSDDRDTAVNGGMYGWVAEGAFGTLDETIFAMEPGETSDGVNTGDFTYFFKVAEFDDARTVETKMIGFLKEAAIQEWLANEKGNHRVTSCFGSGSVGGACDWQYDWLVKQMREAAIE